MSELFELPYDPSWGYGQRFFLDVEHRYTKSHRLVREALPDLAGKRILDLGCSRGLMLERFRRYADAELVGAELDPEVRPDAEAPSLLLRCSCCECSESLQSSASASAKTVIAWLNATPCFSTLREALRASQANTLMYIR